MAGQSLPTSRDDRMAQMEIGLTAYQRLVLRALAWIIKYTWCGVSRRDHAKGEGLALIERIEEELERAEDGNSVR